MILRSSLLLSYCLWNFEAWVNLFEKTSEHWKEQMKFFSKRFQIQSQTPATPKYLELGIYPIRLELIEKGNFHTVNMAEKEKYSMMCDVFKATCDSPVKNNIVKPCSKYDIIKY